MASRTYSEGDRVSWNWGWGEGKGVVRRKFTRRVTKEIHGKAITRDATPRDPAYLVERDDGEQLLVKQSELMHD